MGREVLLLSARGHHGGSARLFIVRSEFSMACKGLNIFLIVAELSQNLVRKAV